MPRAGQLVCLTSQPLLDFINSNHILVIFGAMCLQFLGTHFFNFCVVKNSVIFPCNWGGFVAFRTAAVWFCTEQLTINSIDSLTKWKLRSLLSNIESGIICKLWASKHTLQTNRTMNSSAQNSLAQILLMAAMQANHKTKFSKVYIVDFTIHPHSWFAAISTRRTNWWLLLT